MSKKSGRPPRKKRGPAPPLQAPGAPKGPDAQDRVRRLIGAELERQDALARSRQPLALLAEASIRATDDATGLGYLIVDANGSARTREDDAGVTVPFTIADLVGELRGEHPALFQGESGAASPAPPVEPVADTEANPEPPTIARVHSGPAAEPAPPVATASIVPESIASPVRREPDEPRASPSVKPERDWILLAAPDPNAPVVPKDVAAFEAPAAPHDSPMAAPPAEPRATSTPIRRPREPRILSVEEIRRPRAAMLPPAWMPSRTTWLRVLYVAAFVGGLVAYSAVRHLT